MISDQSLTDSPTVADRQEAAAEDIASHDDALLQASRRVDWRYLLPDPYLGHVVCIGKVSQKLVHSLQLFSASLTVTEIRPARGRPVEQFHVAVVCNPDLEALQEAARFVELGGFLYVEANGLPLRSWTNRSAEVRGGFKRLRLSHPDGYRAEIERLGFDDIRAQWHWPDFESCNMIIPLDSEGAMRHVFGRGGRSTKARLRAASGRWLSWSGLLPWVIPCFSVVARKGHPQYRDSRHEGIGA